MKGSDQMPARRWLESGPLSADFLVPYPAEEMPAYRVSDDAKSRGIEPHAGMAEAVLPDL